MNGSAPPASFSCIHLHKNSSCTTEIYLKRCPLISIRVLLLRTENSHVQICHFCCHSLRSSTYVMQSNVCLSSGLKTKHRKQPNDLGAEQKLISRQTFLLEFFRRMLGDSRFLQASCCYVILLQSPWLEAISPLHPSSSSSSPFFFSFLHHVPQLSSLSNCTNSIFPHLYSYFNLPKEF